MFKQQNLVKVAESLAWKTIGMVNKYVVIKLIMQYNLFCCLPYERCCNIVIYEGQELAIQ